jgi:hypothetical protein
LDFAGLSPLPQPVNTAATMTAFAMWNAVENQRCGARHFTLTN